MKLQDQVCSLEQAKRLKELGIRQDSSEFFWAVTKHQGELMVELAMPHAKGMYVPDQSDEREGITSSGCDEEYEAFTVAELGVMLPTTITFNGTQKASIDMGWMNAFYITYRRHSSLKYCTKIIENAREVGARADMLIHLLESGLVTPDQVNSRLA